MTIKNGILVEPNFVRNNIFSEGTELDRDNSNSFFIKLKKQLYENGIILNTPDVSKHANVAIEIHLNIQENVTENVEKRVLILLEDELIVDRISKNLNKYDIIFTWDRLSSNNQNVQRIFFPNHSEYNSAFKNFTERTNTICMIAGNKNLQRRSNLNLYSERVRAIKYFERNINVDFSLYGNGWDNFAAASGFFPRFFTKALNAANRYAKLQPYKNYKGLIKRKPDVLRDTKFSICYENVSRQNYITEKIFDCFKCGCVPVYMGAPNVTEHIPKECFIDFRLFKNYQQLSNHLRSMSASRYQQYQESILKFLRSSYFQENFTNEAICKKIVDKLI